MNEKTENIGGKLERKIYIKPYDRMVEDIVNGIDTGKIILNPEYQRNYVWDNVKASKLIESILLNIPIPVIYASEDMEGNWNIVDGLQRLYSIQRFLSNDFKLSGLESIPEINNYKYNTLPQMYKNKVNKGEFRIIVLQNDSDPNIQFDIFMRLNTGSVKLNAQELRNCLYRGALNDLVKKELSINEYVKKLFPKSMIKRMVIEEHILRFLAINDCYDEDINEFKDYNGRMNDLINKFMNNKKDCSSDELSDYKILFEETIEKAWEIYGDNAFKIDKSSDKMNGNLMDCILLAFKNKNICELILKKNEITVATDSLLENSSFMDSITRATGNTKNLKIRHDMFNAMLRSVYD